MIVIYAAQFSFTGHSSHAQEESVANVVDVNSCEDFLI